MDDVVQEVFIAIHNCIGTLEQPESLRSWIYGIARRVAGSYHRKKRSAVITTAAGHIEPEALQPECATPQRLAEQCEQARLLWKLLEQLDPVKREVLVLAELEEMTATEIADAIDVPLNTVYSRLRVARQELEQALRRHRTQILRRELAVRLGADHQPDVMHIA